MRALRHRGFRLVLLTTLFGMAGESVLILVLAVWANALTGSATAAAVTLFLVSVPYLAAPLGGWVVDRCGSRPTLIATYLVTALVVLSLCLVRGTGQVGMVYAVAICYGASVVLVDACSNGLVKAALPPALLAEANGATQTARQGLRLFGPLAGTALFSALGGQAVAIVAAGCLALAALPLVALHVGHDAPGDDEDGAEATRWRSQMAVGIRFVLTDRVLRLVVSGTALAILFLQMADATIFSLVQSGLHRPPEFVGLLVSIQALGGITGGLMTARFIRRVGAIRALITACGLLAVGTGLLAVPTTIAATIAMVVLGLGLPLVSVAFATQVQQRAPQRSIGRVSAAASGVTSLAQVISLATGATLTTLVGYRTLALSILVGLVVSAGYLGRGMRSADRTDRAQQTAAGERRSERAEPI